MRSEQLAAELNEPVTFDQIVGPWHVYQLRKGHRFSTDDLLVACIAIEARPNARRLLDIGAGIGSVGLMTLHAMPEDAHLTMVEVQLRSHTLARASIEDNTLSGRIKAIHQDLREYQPPGRCFDLVTGSPPYTPVGMGVISPHPQRAGARMELRGDVFDYCRAAARALAPEGAFCFVHAAADVRPEAAVRDAGLVLCKRQDVVFRSGQAPTIALFTCAWSGDREDAPPIVVRDENGRWTPEYIELRKKMTTRS